MMTTTRDYTLPPEAVEAAGKALDRVLFSPGIKSESWRSIVATATITAFIDHMVASGLARCDHTRIYGVDADIIRIYLEQRFPTAYMPAPKDPTT